jgi:hypothetical protein
LCRCCCAVDDFGCVGVGGDSVGEGRGDGFGDTSVGGGDSVGDGGGGDASVGGGDSVGDGGCGDGFGEVVGGGDGGNR